MPEADQVSGTCALRDDELLKRLRALYSAAAVNEVALELMSAREDGDLACVEKVHDRYTTGCTI